MVESLDDFLRLVERIRRRLASRGLKFTDEGFPVLPRESFVREFPDDVVDYGHRSSAADPSRTAVCLFLSDREIYRRTERVEGDLPEYRRFAAVVAADVTVTTDMDLEFQMAVMQLNQLFMAEVAMGGVLVSPSLRCGVAETQRCFSAVPEEVIWTASFLGCAPLASDADMSFQAKVMGVLPSGVMLYGKRDKRVEAQLARMGIQFRLYRDHGARRRGRG